MRSHTGIETDDRAVAGQVSALAAESLAARDVVGGAVSFVARFDQPVVDPLVVSLLVTDLVIAAAYSRIDRNESENFVSRSISRYFLPRRNPSSASLRLRATWRSLGFAVHPAKCTRRVANSMTKSR